MQFEILAGLRPFILQGITLLILRGHHGLFVWNSCRKRSAHLIVQGFRLLHQSLMHWLTKWEGVTRMVWCTVFFCTSRPSTLQDGLNYYVDHCRSMGEEICIWIVMEGNWTNWSCMWCAWCTPSFRRASVVTPLHCLRGRKNLHSVSA